MLGTSTMIGSGSSSSPAGGSSSAGVIGNGTDPPTLWLPAGPDTT